MKALFFFAALWAATAPAGAEISQENLRVLGGPALSPAAPETEPAVAAPKKSYSPATQGQGARAAQPEQPPVLRRQAAEETARRAQALRAIRRYASLRRQGAPVPPSLRRTVADIYRNGILAGTSPPRKGERDLVTRWELGVGLQRNRSYTERLVRPVKRRVALLTAGAALLLLLLLILLLLAAGVSRRQSRRLTPGSPLGAGTASPPPHPAGGGGQSRRPGAGAIPRV